MKSLHKIRQRRLQQELEHNPRISYKQAMIKAGFSESTACQAARSTTLKATLKHIEDKLKAKDITVDLVVERLNQDRDLALAKQDYASVIRVDELLGRYLMMFGEKRHVDATITTQEEQGILSNYISGNRITKQ